MAETYEARQPRPAEPPRESCATCRFFWWLTRDALFTDADGQCRRAPPQLLDITVAAGSWPEIEAEDWCGAFEHLRPSEAIHVCPQCKGIFEVGPGTGRRLDARFCCNAHRVAFNSHKRGKEIVG